MRSWQSKKKEIQSLTETEKSELSLAASLVAQIIETREKKGWTQRDLAQRSGIAQSSIARFERCGAMPRLFCQNFQLRGTSPRLSRKSIKRPVRSPPSRAAFYRFLLQKKFMCYIIL